MDEYDYDDSICDDCTCCSRQGCHRGWDTECPRDSNGRYLCPCTEE